MIDLNSFNENNRSGSWTLRDWITTSKKSNKFDSYKVYIIEVTDTTELFIKIGRTFTTLKNRFKSKTDLPYNYKIIKIIEDNPFRIFKLELKLKKMCKDYRYTPKKDFNGMYECFEVKALDAIKDYCTDIKE